MPVLRRSRSIEWTSTPMTQSLIVEAARRIRTKKFVLDGEAVLRKPSPIPATSRVLQATGVARMSHQPSFDSARPSSELPADAKGPYPKLASEVPSSGASKSLSERSPHLPWGPFSFEASAEHLSHCRR